MDSILWLRGFASGSFAVPALTLETMASARLMNHLVGVPAGFVEMQVKYHRRSRSEVAMLDSHEWQGALKACVFNFDTGLGLHQFGSVVLAVLMAVILSTWIGKSPRICTYGTRELGS